MKKSKNISKTKGFRRFVTENWKRLALAIIVLFVGGLIYKSVTKPPTGIETQRVYRRTLVDIFSANGKIKASTEANIKFYSPGKVSWIGVKKGDKVHTYQSIASLDTVSLNASYQQALNNLRNFSATADSVLDSVQGHDTDESFAMRATRTTAEVGKDNAYEAVIIAQNNLKNAVITSPINGTVVDTNGIIAGLNLSGSDVESKYIRVVDLGTLYFEADVDEVDYSKVKEGQEVLIDIDAFADNECKGTVSFVGRNGQETSGGVVTIPVEVTLNDCGLELAVDLNGNANFVTQTLNNVLVIDKKYVVQKDGKDYVWVQTDNSVRDRKEVPVKLGKTTSTKVEVVEGLKEGDLVVFIP